MTYSGIFDEVDIKEVKKYLNEKDFKQFKK